MTWNVWSPTSERWESSTSFTTRAGAESFRDDVCAPDRRRAGPYEIRKVGDVLEEHGTKLMQLKPSMIWRCAMDDLGRLKHNRAVAASAKVPPNFQQEGEFKQYAFHRSHVIKAETANDILRAAIAEPGKGQASGKRDTRLLYSDLELLKAALQ